MKVMRIVVAVLAFLFLLLTLMFLYMGGQLVWFAIGTHSNRYYVDYGYGAEAAMQLVPALLAAAFFVWAMLRRKGGTLALLLGFGVLLLDAVAIPSRYMPPLKKAQYADESRMVATRSALNQWAGAHGRYPSSTAELDDAIAKGLDPEFRVKKSHYALAGGRLPYQVVFSQGKQAQLQLPAQAAPGTIYLVVSVDQQQAWMTMTTLEAPVSNNVRMLQDTEKAGPEVVALNYATEAHAAPAIAKPPQ